MMHAHVISWRDVDYGGDIDNPDSSLFDHRILAEGDSWFTLGGIPTSNLLFSMRFDDSTIIVNCGYPGDTIKNMAQIVNNADLREAMSKWYGSDWDLILLSGGGNDIIDDAWKIVKPRTGSGSGADAWIDQNELAHTLQVVDQGYRDIIALRDDPDSSCINKPVVVHTYDWVTPRNSPARFIMVPVFGPWLYHAMKDAAVPVSRWNDVSDYILGALRDTIQGLATGPNALPNFHVVTTQDTLVPADLGTTHESNDWMNEIHPSPDGYKKLATKISRKVRALL